MTRVRRVVEGVPFRTLGDLDAEKAEECLKAIRDSEDLGHPFASLATSPEGRAGDRSRAVLRCLVERTDAGGVGSLPERRSDGCRFVAIRIREVDLLDFCAQGGHPGASQPAPASVARDPHVSEHLLERGSSAFIHHGRMMPDFRPGHQPRVAKSHGVGG